MITWLQTNLGKHYKWAFFILLVLITVSFVFVLGVGGGHQTTRAPERRIFGVDINSQQEMRRYSLDTSISIDLQFGERGLSGRRFEDYLFERLGLIGLADKLGIPGPTEKEVADFIRGLERFRGESGQFDVVRYQQFRDQINTSSQITDSDVSRVIAEDFRMRRAGELLGGPGYLQGWEADRLLASLQTEFSLDTAELSYSGFQPEVVVTEEAIASYFEQSSARYRVPERRVVRQVRFSRANFLDKVPAPDEAALLAHYTANTSKYTPPPAAPAEGQPAVPAVPKPFEEVRAEVVSAVRNEMATRLAGEAAVAFTLDLFNASLKAGSPELDSFVTSRALESLILEPFTAQAGPTGQQWTPEITREGFNLSGERLVTDPLALGDDYIVLVYQDTLPEQLPELATIRSTVEKDYREQERRRLFTERGIEVRRQLEEKMSAGASFADAARALELTTAQFTGVNRRSPPAGLNFAVFTQLDELPTGQLSNMISTADKGVFVVVRERTEPAPESLGFMAGFVRQNLTQQTANETRMLAVAEMVRAELERTASPEELEQMRANEATATPGS